MGGRIDGWKGGWKEGRKVEGSMEGRKDGRLAGRRDRLMEGRKEGRKEGQQTARAAPASHRLRLAAVAAPRNKAERNLAFVTDNRSLEQPNNATRLFVPVD